MPTARVGDRLPGDRSSGRSGRDAIAVSAATASTLTASTVMVPTVMVPTVVTVAAPVAAVAAVQKDVKEGTGEDQQKWPQAEEVRPVLGREKEASDEKEPGGGECRSERGGGGHGVRLK